MKTKNQNDTEECGEDKKCQKYLLKKLVDMKRELLVSTLSKPAFPLEKSNDFDKNQKIIKKIEELQEMIQQ